MTAPETLADLRSRRKAAGVSQADLAAEMRRRGHRWTANVVSYKEKGKRGTWLHEVDAWREVLGELEAARTA